MALGGRSTSLLLTHSEYELAKGFGLPAPVVSSVVGAAAAAGQGLQVRRRALVFAGPRGPAAACPRAVPAHAAGQYGWG